MSQKGNVEIQDLTPFMHLMDKKKHKKPHISHQNTEAVISIPDGKLLEGKIKQGKLRLIQAWIEIHKDELMAAWELAIKGEKLFKIAPLK